MWGAGGDFHVFQLNPYSLYTAAYVVLPLSGKVTVNKANKSTEALSQSLSNLCTANIITQPTDQHEHTHIEMQAIWCCHLVHVRVLAEIRVVHDSAGMHHQSTTTNFGICYSAKGCKKADVSSLIDFTGYARKGDKQIKRICSIQIQAKNRFFQEKGSGSGLANVLPTDWPPKCHPKILWCN